MTKGEENHMNANNDTGDFLPLLALLVVIGIAYLVYYLLLALIFVAAIVTGVALLAFVITGAIDAGTFLIHNLTLNKKEDLPMPMDAKTKRAVAEDILNQLDEEQHGGLPAPRAPHQDVIRRAQERKGLLSKVFGDRFERIQRDQAFARLSTEEENKTKLLKVSADTAVKKAEIHSGADIANYEHQSQWWRAVQAKKNAAAAIITQQKDLQELVEMVIELELPQDIEKDIVKKLYHLYNPNGKAER